jgi:hypothetical protein
MGKKRLKYYLLLMSPSQRELTVTAPSVSSAGAMASRIIDEDVIRIEELDKNRNFVRTVWNGDGVNENYETYEN